MGCSRPAKARRSKIPRRCSSCSFRSTSGSSFPSRRAFRPSSPSPGGSSSIGARRFLRDGKRSTSSGGRSCAFPTGRERFITKSALTWCHRTRGHSPNAASSSDERKDCARPFGCASASSRSLTRERPSARCFPRSASASVRSSPRHRRRARALSSAAGPGRGGPQSLRWARRASPSSRLANPGGDWPVPLRGRGTDSTGFAARSEMSERAPPGASPSDRLRHGAQASRPSRR